MMTKINSSSTSMGKVFVKNNKPYNIVANVSKIKPILNVSDLDCFKCGGKWHLARDCPTKSDPKMIVYSNVFHCLE